MRARSEIALVLVDVDRFLADEEFRILVRCAARLSAVLRRKKWVEIRSLRGKFVEAWNPGSVGIG